MAELQWLISILTVSEVRWPESSKINVDEHTIYYVGNTTSHHCNGGTVIIDKKMNNSVKNFVSLLAREALLQIRASPRDINIIYVYAPIIEKPDIEIHQFYFG